MFLNKNVAEFPITFELTPYARNYEPKIKKKNHPKLVELSSRVLLENNGSLNRVLTIYFLA